MAGSDRRQLVIVGAGPGGYAAAFTAAALGVQVTLIDREPNPGGVCLYRGCIPAKALLHVAKVIADARRARDWGVTFPAPTIDLARLRAWKNGVVSRLTQGLGLLAKARKVEYIQGEAVFVNSNTLRVRKKRAGTEEITFAQGIVATGSSPVALPGLPADAPQVMYSDESLEVRRVPRTLLVIGGGYIGLEQGDIYARLGAKVSVVEMMPQLMPGADPELVNILHQQFEKRFESILLNTKVAEVRQQKTGLKVRFAGTGLKRKEATYEQVLVAVGRKANAAGIGLENTKVQLTEHGCVLVNEQCRTDDPALLAVGDVTPGLQLAHKASHQGIVAAQVAAGRAAAFAPRAVPFVEYTDPELAECGLSEAQARAQNVPYKVARFPWQASGRALTLGEGVGLTKLLIEPDSERLLGVGIVGTNAGEVIPEAALALEMGATATDIAMTIHPHPSLSETFMHAAARFLGRSVDIGPSR
jgi:dihydrolipoamide dehydrogenase